MQITMMVLDLPVVQMTIRQYKIEIPVLLSAALGKYPLQFGQTSADVGLENARHV